jgi:hypothetical protein
MRDEIRREAAQYLNAAWWLVPIAFAVAGVAAAVMTDADPPELAVSMVAVPDALPDARPSPAVMPAVVSVPASTTTEPVYEVEHIQAF